MKKKKKQIKIGIPNWLVKDSYKIEWSLRSTFIFIFCVYFMNFPNKRKIIEKAQHESCLVCKCR